MKLSIVTINYNNVEGLKKTLDSVAHQTILSLSSASSFQLEHIIVDGASTDGAPEIIREYAENAAYPVVWVSEKDKGIYNAMNKGIRMATGEYIQILNSGDILAATDVCERMLNQLSVVNSQLSAPVAILYGNMIKEYPDGHRTCDRCGRQRATSSFLYFYRGTLNHDSAYIRRDLFERYGYYNEEMKICSDWEWYIRAICVGDNGYAPLSPQEVVYTNIDVTIFDMTGVSENNGKNRDVIQRERREYLESVLPASVLRDYDNYVFPITQYCRLKRYHLWGVVYFMERVLFKLEKWKILR